MGLGALALDRSPGGVCGVDGRRYQPGPRFALFEPLRGHRLEGLLPRWEPSPQTSGQRILEAVIVVAIPSSDDARGDAVPRISILFLQPGGQ